MCTATYIKDLFGKIIFTTNRDEEAARPTAAPKVHTVNGQNLLFPQDLLAGGTWVAVNGKGRICCVLNGAKGEHQWLGTKAEKSRGQVLLEAFQFSSVDEYFKEEDMRNAHPFTLLWIDHQANEIGEIRWNGTEKWLTKIPADQPHIWSAHTLYPAAQRKERETYFHDFVRQSDNQNSTAIWELHQASKSEQGLLLENSPHVNTVSTTQIIMEADRAEMTYFPMEEGLRFVVEI